jgi:hypothetical protein
VFKYSLPITQSISGYGGIYFQVDQPQDMSSFDYLEATINFADRVAFCDLHLTDDKKNVAFVRLGERLPPGSDITVTANGALQTFRVPLGTNFRYKGVDLERVTSVTCHVPGEAPRGDHEFTISAVRFCSD